MALVYPIYLDTPMMTGFLASLEGGIIEEANLESKTGDSKEKAGSATLKAGVSNLLSGILGIGAEAELTRKVSESLESQYKGTVRFPNAALFIRLRDLLLDQKQVKLIDSQSKLASVSIGDIVEFRGSATPNPAYQIRHAFGQIQPLIEAYYNIADAQFDQEVVKVENTPVSGTYESGNDKIVIQNKKQISALCDTIRANQKSKRSEAALYQMVNKVLTGLFLKDSIDTLLFKAKDFQVVCRVYPVFARNERILDIHDASWHCLGKVIGIIPETDKFDLLKGSPISYFAKDLFPDLAGLLKNDSLNIKITEPIIPGPLIILATMAIFV
jgi:hypothetical protein